MTALLVESEVQSMVADVEDIDVSEDVACIGSLPTLLLQEVLSCLLPRPTRIDAPSEQWLPVVRLMCARRGMAADAVGESLQESIPSLDPSVSGECTSWPLLLASLRGAGHATWQLMQPLRAHRGKTKFSTPLQVAPSISGASLCFVGCGRIVLFGGRSSVSGDTVDTSYVVQIPVRSSGVAQWEELHCTDGPAARCYHAAFRGSGESNMFVFGGAGVGAQSLLADTWLLKVISVPVDEFGAMASRGMWERLDEPTAARTPCARSSHVCSPWKSQQGCAVLHGGLGEQGVLSDTWLLPPGGEWVELHTSGASVARAHHSGGVVQDSLLIYSGQDKGYLTVDSFFVLQLLTAVWTEVHLKNGPSPRIDAAVAVVDTVGLMVFGGVGVDFEFESPSPWMLPGASRPDSQPRLVVANTERETPCARACSTMCSDGLCVYVFGGFEGEKDLGDLWCLDLVPGCFESSSSSQCGLFLLPQVRAQMQGGQPKFNLNNWHAHSDWPTNYATGGAR